MIELPLKDNERTKAKSTVKKCVEQIKMLPNEGFDDDIGCSVIPS